MVQLHAFRVSCRPASVANRIDIFRLGHSAWAVWISLTNEHNILKSSQCSTTGLSSTLLFCINAFHSNEYQILYHASFTAVLHIEDLFSVVRRAEDRGHLRLIEDVIDLIMAHGIVEAYHRCIIVHGCQQKLCPLGAILGHHTDETPLFSLTIDLRGQIERDHTICQVANILVDLTVRLPLIVTDDWCASLIILTSNQTRAQEGLIASTGQLTMEALQERILTSSQHWLSAKVVVKLWGDFGGD